MNNIENLTILTIILILLVVFSIVYKKSYSVDVNSVALSLANAKI